MSVLIENIIESNLPALAAFKASAWPIADREHYGEQLPDFTQHNITITAQKDGKIVGYVSGNAVAGVLHVSTLLVGAEHRNHGIGRQLMVTIEAQGKELGCHKSWLDTGTSWNARFLYEKLGYTAQATLANFYGNKDFIFYDKDL
jgi:ribosomal protein S18 acetylase RimI-like enzyme